jgi:hypothetical protein
MGGKRIICFGHQFQYHAYRSGILILSCEDVIVIETGTDLVSIGGSRDAQ